MGTEVLIMADYVSWDIARDRLHSACKAGIILSVLFLLLALLYAGIAALIFINVKLPDIVWSALYVIVPTMSNTTLALADCATKAALFLLMSIVGILMFSKVKKTDEPFRTGQLKQMRFLAVMLVLLGFLPTVVGNAVVIIEAMRKGGSPMAVMSFDANGMCIIAGLITYYAVRMLVAGSVLQSAVRPVLGSATTTTQSLDSSTAAAEDYLSTSTTSSTELTQVTPVEPEQEPATTSTEL